MLRTYLCPPRIEQLRAKRDVKRLLRLVDFLYNRRRPWHWRELGFSASRYQAKEALCDVASKSDADRLIAALANSRANDAAGDALVRIGGSAVESLVSALNRARTTSAISLRREIIAILAEIPGPKAGAALSQELKTASESDVDQLIDALANGRRFPAGRRALVRIGTEDVEFLVSALNRARATSAISLRHKIIAILADIPDPKVGEALSRELTITDRPDTEIALALACRRDVRALGPLLECLDGYRPEYIPEEELKALFRAIAELPLRGSDDSMTSRGVTSLIKFGASHYSMREAIASAILNLDKSMTKHRCKHEWRAIDFDEFAKINRGGSREAMEDFLRRRFSLQQSSRVTYCKCGYPSGQTHSDGSWGPLYGFVITEGEYGENIYFCRGCGRPVP